jgi:tetratricopeptide (TPR) repeat protein
MPVKFPAVPAYFTGRDDYVTRFKARLDHFGVFVYGGISGIGKTALMLRLAKETRPLGLRGAVFLPLWPGESMSSILARTEAAVDGAAKAAADRPGDPFARLGDYLEEKRIALLLDDLHNLRREELLVLVRSVRLRGGKYRVLATSSGELELPAVDRGGVHSERVGPLTPAEVKKVAASYGVRAGEPQERLMTDAAKGGCTGHALTLRYLLALFGSDLPPGDFFSGQTSRSVNAFRAVVEEADSRFDSKEQEVLRGLVRVGLPISKTTAPRQFGATITKLLKRGLVDLIEGDICVHPLVAQALGGEYALSSSSAKAIARHLKDQGITRIEPQRVLRAAELLAHAGPASAAIDALTEGWEAARDFGFLEAYLKSVASIPSTPALEQRLKLLSARARMRQGNVVSVREELESLTKSKDGWTRQRAYAALTYVYSELSQHRKVVDAYEAIRSGTVQDHVMVPAGTLAATSMVRVGRVAEAEKLARSLLTRIRGTKQLDREGELHRLLARVYAQGGRLDEAVREAQAAAKAFEACGDLYHAATAQGFIGDLYRETGDFELAKEAFGRFHQLAQQWGDRNLLQVAELADAWVSLDIGDLTHAAKRIAAVEKEMSAAPSRRLRRYLAAARALLEAGRGRHKEASVMLERVVEVWNSAGQRAIADILRAQLVRSLIASNDLDKARGIVDTALERLDPKSAAPRVASFLRESALVRLRRKDVERAMQELAEARKLFAKGGNRREEALTLYRIAYAAFEEGDMQLATSRAKEALSLARKIKHPRVIALCRELQGKVALINDDSKTAVTASREALQALRKLGDEIGTLHVSESLLRSMIVAGDLTSAIRLGPKVADQAERLQIREVRVRAIVLTGVALLRRGRVDAASRCFREIPDGSVSPMTAAMMWRLGEALASVRGNEDFVVTRRRKWVAAVRRLPEHGQETTRRMLRQLALPPQERSYFRAAGKSELLDTEQIAWIEPSDYDLWIDLQTGWILDRGERVEIPDAAQGAVFTQLALAAGEVVSNAELHKAVFNEEQTKQATRKINAPIRGLLKTVRNAKHLKIVQVKEGLRLVLPKRAAVLVPRLYEVKKLTAVHARILRLLRRFGTLPIQAVQDDCGLTRSAARRELGVLVKRKLVETVRDGRGQAFRLL